MSDQFDRDLTAAALRDSLIRHADEAPGAGLLAERIVAATREQPAGPARRRSGGWRVWALPLVAAGAVAAVVATVAGLAHSHPRASSPPAANLPTVGRLQAPAPTGTAPVGRTGPTSASVDATTLRNVRILDLTFAGTDRGWALAAADCVHGAGRCTALLRTTDGRTWGSMPGAEFNVAGVRGCADPCVTGLRFATDRIGYAFGPTAVLLTTDGGQSWKRQAGLGADALETLGGNVIVARAIGAAPALLTAPIGSTRWTPRSTDGWPRTAKRLWLGRSGGAAALQFSTYDTGTGTGKANAGALFRSSDDGATWTRVDDPCPYIGAGYWNVSTAAALAPDGTVVVGCGSGGGDDPNFYGGGTITSTDGGRTFETPVTGGKVGGARLLAAVDKQTQIEYAPKEACGCVGNLRLYRSTDAGNSWTPVAGVSVKDVTFIGFESAAVGRIVTGGGKAIWTTRDGGASWTEVVFS